MKKAVISGGVATIVDLTADEIAARRDAWRETGTLDKVTFLNRAADMGMITDDEAIAAASGTWPDSFNAALPSDAAQARAAKVLWAGTATIRRNAPLIEAIIASDIPISDAQVDALFGWAG